MAERLREEMSSGSPGDTGSQVIDAYCRLGHPLYIKRLLFVQHMCAVCKSPQHHWPEQLTVGWYCDECGKLRLPAWRCAACVHRNPRPACEYDVETLRAKSQTVHMRSSRFNRERYKPVSTQRDALGASTPLSVKSDNKHVIVHARCFDWLQYRFVLLGKQ